MLLDASRVEAGSVVIKATAEQTLTAVLDSYAKSSGGSAFGKGTSLALNAAIATNRMLGGAVVAALGLVLYDADRSAWAALLSGLCGLRIAQTMAFSAHHGPTGPDEGRR